MMVHITQPLLNGCTIYHVPFFASAKKVLSPLPSSKSDSFHNEGREAGKMETGWDRIARYARNGVLAAGVALPVLTFPLFLLATLAYPPSVIVGIPMWVLTLGVTYKCLMKIATDPPNSAEKRLRNK